MLVYSRLEGLARDKNSSLLGPFVNYKENSKVKICTKIQDVLFKFIIPNNYYLLWKRKDGNKQTSTESD
jgi:hypothetical protein